LGQERHCKSRPRRPGASNVSIATIFRPHPAHDGSRTVRRIKRAKIKKTRGGSGGMGHRPNPNEIRPQRTHSPCGGWSSGRGRKDGRDRPQADAYDELFLCHHPPSNQSFSAGVRSLPLFRTRTASSNAAKKQSHREELDRRLAHHEKDPGNLLTLDELRARIEARR